MLEIYPSMRTGVVLSGGGAKGAYQVGVLKALLELGSNVDMIAGASIGALNGGVLASAPNLKVGVERLDRLWKTLANSSPLKLKMPSYLTLLNAAGLSLGGAVAPSMNAFLKAAAHLGLLPARAAESNAGLLSDSPLKALMHEYLDMEGLMRGIPLYVSVYESAGGLRDALTWIAAETTGLFDTKPSSFLHVQSLPPSDRSEALLASAALPLLYQARAVGQHSFADGGLGGTLRSQGNTPITPLIKAGCKQVIVTNLSDGALWSRQDFPDTTVIEIRPQKLVTPDGRETKALLGFDAANIQRLQEQGYEDTLHCVGHVMRASTSYQAVKTSAQTVTTSLQSGQAVDRTLEDAMGRFRAANSTQQQRIKDGVSGS